MQGNRPGSWIRPKDEIVLPLLRRALELQPTNTKFYQQIAWHYWLTGRPKEAAAAFRKAAEVAPPGSAEAYSYLGEAAWVDGDHRAARQNFEKCLSIAPLKLEALRGLGRAHRELGENDQAVAAFTKALECLQMPSSMRTDFYFDRGAIYLYQQKNYAAAVSDFNSALELQPYQWYIYPLRAIAHFNLKHYEQALADLAKHLELFPDNSTNLDAVSPEEVASCPDEKFRTGMLALADKTVQILKSKPDAPRLLLGRHHNHLGYLLDRLGKPAEAEAQYRAAIKIYWQLDEKEKHGGWYDRPVVWIDKNKPQDEELKRFRAEAAALLGMAKPFEAQNKKD